MTSPPTPALSPRELEVARLVAEGLSDKEMSKILLISTRTVQDYLERITVKLQCPPARNRRTEITRYVILSGE